MDPYLGGGRARGRGRGVVPPPRLGGLPPHPPSEQSQRWSLLSGGPRPQIVKPIQLQPIGRGSKYVVNTVYSGDSISGAGRGVRFSSDESSQKPYPYIVGRPDTNRGSLRLRREAQERLLLTRPKTVTSKIGISGKLIQLQANYFCLDRKPDWQIYQYRVDFKPDVPSDRVRKYLVYTQKEMLGGYLFDGTQIFVTKKLEGDIIERTAKGRIDDETYLIIFKYAAQVSMSESTSLQVLNLILRRSMDCLQLQLVGRNFFDPDAKSTIPEFNLELWPGYTTSIRQHEQDILVCTEIAHKVMRMETIYDIMNRIRGEQRDFKKVLLENVLGTTVLTAYNNKTYRIDDINFDMKASDTFETKNGPISFLTYYKNRYNLTIKDPNQPLILSKAKARDLRAGQDDTILLIPELCRATGFTTDMRNNFRTMKAMSEHTKLAPRARIQKLLDFNRRLIYTPDSQTVLSEWNLMLKQELVEVAGRILPYENILFGNDVSIRQNIKVDWTQDFRNNSMFYTIPLKRWYIITSQRATKETKEFVSLIISAGRGMRFEVALPKVVILTDDRTVPYSNALENCVKENPQMIMCVVTNINADRYSNIKKKCCVERPVPTQVICQRTITPKSGNTRGLLSIATKVAIQMNCKLGGAAWSIDLPIKGLMTMGFDVCHDAKDKKKSYGALVATMDLKECSDYFSAVSPHTNGEELSNQLAVDVTKALKQYRDIHGTLPARICMFRDGVGDGQIQYVVEHELKILQAKLIEIYQNSGVGQPLKFLFIIVSKRINTRFFFNYENPPAGTVVDDIVTLPERYDFFLVSQSVREGTVSPTSYNVIHDSFGLTPDRVQILSYKFTHLYYNWSGTVRVPSVCQYAHKLAFLVSQSIHQRPSTALEKKLFFL